MPDTFGNYNCRQSGVLIVAHQRNNNLTREPVGIFTCSCGFIYSRKGPDKSYDDRARFNRVIVFGAVWEENLIKFASSGLSLREIARRLGVDVKTIIRHLSRLQFSDPTHSGNLYDTDKRDGYRNRWQSNIISNQGIGVKALRKLAPDLYAWLYRHDGKWLQDHSPRKTIASKQQEQVDWNQRDQDLLGEVAWAVASIKDYTHPAVKVSVSAIGKKLGALAIIQRKRDRLPMTAQTIADAEETRVSFAERRLRTAMENFKASYIIPEEWELLKAAGIRDDLYEHVSALVGELCQSERK
ncbi:MAG: TnsD family Tn7-like transposition protein [Desulfuromonadaceae bacterium]|nr:TnsD family Tn7-like transposition protein [Desulfuromonadaceae bacterium]